MGEGHCQHQGPSEACNPGVVAEALATLAHGQREQASRLGALRKEHECHEKRLDRLDGVLKGAGGNGHPPWSERLILLEDWQRRREKLLEALPTQLTEIHVQLQLLVSQRKEQSSAKGIALWTALGSLVVAAVVGMGSAALMWWSGHG